MDREAFEHHLAEPLGRDHVPAGARSGAAGGALCGDLVSMHVALDGERVADAGFAAEGCGALTAAASAAVSLVRGAPLLDAARVGTGAIAAELGGLSPGKLHAADLVADALHQALGAAAAHDAALPARADRTLVAMSGGVDSAVAALLVARAGRDTACVTVELWRDPDNDAEASCCSASAVRLARSVSHALGLPHLTLDLRDEFRAGVVEPWLADHRAGLTPNPCVRCNGHVRLDAMLALADRLGAADLATGHYARVTDGPGPLLRAAADPAKDQTYMLSALDPATLARLRFPLGELIKPQVREIAAEAEIAVASRAESQDLCFLAGTGKAAFLAKHGALGDLPGEIVDRDGDRAGPSSRRPSLHRRPAQGPRRRRRRAAVRAAPRGRPRRRRSARRARDRPRRRPRGAAAPRRRPGRPRQAALPLAPARLPRRPAGGGRRACAARAGAVRAGHRRGRAGPDRLPAGGRRRARLGDDRGAAATLSAAPDITSSMPPTDDRQRRFGVLFDTHRRRVLAYALRRVDDPADAADVLAETFLTAWRRLDDVPPDALPWLLGVARRVLSNQRRGERRRTGLADRLGHELSVQVPAAPEHDTALVVRQALASLPEADREVLLLEAWEGLAPAQIAVAVGASGVAVRTRLKRARRRLAQELEALDWEGDGVTTKIAEAAR